MAKLPKIPTPFSQQVRRFRYQVLPVLFFFAVLACTVALWKRHRSSEWTVGEVYAVSVDLRAGQDGALIPVADGVAPILLAPVAKGEVLAQLDPSIIEDELGAMRCELARLKADIEAETARLAVDQSDRLQERRLDQRRLALDVERHKLDLLDRQAKLQTDRIFLIQMQSELEVVRAAHAEGVETDFSLQNQEHLRDAALERVDGDKAAIEEAMAQLASIQSRLDRNSQAEPAIAPTDTVVAPIRHAIAAQKARIRQLERQQQALQIRSPIAGKITAIHSRCGQAVQAGDPILTVTAVGAQEVISYLREGHNYRPKVDDEVRIRARSDRRHTYTGHVVRIGAKIEMLPEHQWRSAEHAEWGLPVSIALPMATPLLPGELVDVTFAPDM